ncbi:hypothetical protein GOBAR_AA30737 [Gossypium barbadense]|uniref:Gamma-soluble NSF attachment protein n=1 Tax=Gossypium barbadense TaxID=3634 RepID=A0A2P5WFV2_GOSBA|nr:hypothetical protein GOBAR_AA30737 [Gossypium barbadense]
MESAAALAKELRNWTEVIDFYRRASELYMQCDRPQPASDSLAKAARTRLSLTRWSADWKSATLLYEQAANGFRVSKDYEKAKLAFEKASKGQEMLASDGIIEASCPYFVSRALVNMHALEDALPDDAVQLYTDACVILEDDGKEQMAFDLYRAAASIYVKLEFTDAATFLLRLGLAADKCNARNSQCKAYLSAIIVYLYAHDLKQAEKCYNDCSQIDAFLRSDQNRCASKLLSAYTEGDVEEIKRVAQSSTISNLDNVYSGMWLAALDWLINLSEKMKLCVQIIKLARKLPTGDVAELKEEAAKGEEEALDENDLT